MFLQRTIDDVLENSDDRTEVIAILDGYWPDPGIPMHPRVTLIHHEESIGQRAATNEAARVSRAKYLMKLDAHCAMDKGFDVKLIEAAEELGSDVTQVPLQRNLHVFDWQCDGCGKRTYQGPEPMECECGGKEFHRKIVWKPRGGTKTTYWIFDSDLHFQYGKKKPEGDLTETMSLLGACWFMSRKRFWELDGLDDKGHGSWGAMGTEVACKSWLSGGRLICNKRTYFSHLFRTRADFGFPYKISGRQVSRARKHSQNLWRNNSWSKQVRPLSWLLDHFWPVKGWSDDAHAEVTKAGVAFEAVRKKFASAAKSPPNPKKGIVYYSDCRGNETILRAAREQLSKASNGHEIVAVTLAPVDFGDVRRVLDRERGYLTMFEQILLGLESSTADIVFFCEHDVLYHPSHFDFIPPDERTIYYNENTWKVDAKTGRALHYICRQTSGLCAYREVLLEHYRKRVALVKEHGFSRKIGFEPGTHGRAERVDDLKSEGWMSEFPNIDIRHEKNLTPSRWRQDQFRNQRSCRGWKEAEEVPGWGQTKGCFKEFLNNIDRESLAGG